MLLIFFTFFDYNKNTIFRKSKKENKICTERNTRSLSLNAKIG